ncbi:MAG: permease [Desulfobulbaceae bacterium]|nr:permease [Candidatus Kapabacteria bacterium]MBS4000160.1 permease [Desulfobulbaceae bacterium]
MEWKKEWKILAWIAAVFLAFVFVPINEFRFTNALDQALQLTQWYAQEHVILCLLPAFYIAGAIGVFLNQAAVLKYLGPNSNRLMAYGVASVSGFVLAVCSCTVLPMFAGIYKMGAGLGPATTFLYSGPAINIMAVIMTAKVIGFELGVARGITAIVFSVVIGLIMSWLFIKEAQSRTVQMADTDDDESERPMLQNVIFFVLMIVIILVSNWGNPDSGAGWTSYVYEYKWILTSILSLIYGAILYYWFNVKVLYMAITALVVTIAAFAFPNPSVAFGLGIVGLGVSLYFSGEENRNWFNSSWDFAKQIMPLLFYGVIIAGFLLGMPGGEGIIPSAWINTAVGGDSYMANLIASVLGAFMYFATLTEIPIIQGLMGNGMQKGPALSLLLAGPALSLPSMLVIYSVLGGKKTATYVILVIVMSSLIGYFYSLI